MLLAYTQIACFTILHIPEIVNMVILPKTSVLLAANGISDIVIIVLSSLKEAFNPALCLKGIFSLWIGLLKIVKKAGLTKALSGFMGFFFPRGISCRLFVMRGISLNFSVNIFSV